MQTRNVRLAISENDIPESLAMLKLFRLPRPEKSLMPALNVHGSEEGGADGSARRINTSLATPALLPFKYLSVNFVGMSLFSLWKAVRCKCEDKCIYV